MITPVLLIKAIQVYFHTLIFNTLIIVDYIIVESIQSSLKRDTVFLKRGSKEIFINGYNNEILSLHRANMDLQFILDPYACIAYMINYINKSNRGMSELLKDSISEINDGNFSLRKKFHKIGMLFNFCVL